MQKDEKEEDDDIESEMKKKFKILVEQPKRRSEVTI